MSDVSPAEAVFFAALEKADPVERAAYLDEACAGQPELRARVERLLAAHPQVGDFLGSGVAEGATGPFEGGGPDATASHPGPEAAGAVIAGRYKLLERIGEGGMGSVWMADQTEPVKRRVAVKLVRADRGQSRAILARFEAERQAIALMDHPHIAKLLDASTTDAGQPFFVMELVKGVPITDFCDAHRLGVPDRLALFTQVCGAVQHAHQKGVIHRDLKPSNILVESHDSKPVPKVIDFGLAKATSGLQLTEQTLFTAFGSVMGTPQYMAPEQATFNAVDVDTRADVYALGVILYELLTGTTPLTRDSVRKAQLDELLRLIREQEAPSPSSRLSSSDTAPTVATNRQTEPQRLGRLVRGELDWIVLKALSKERDRRYETASGFARDIERFLNHEPVAAGPPGVGYKLRKFVRRNRPQVVAASLVLLALVAGLGGTAWGLVEARRQTAIAEDEAEKKEAARAEEARQRGVADENARRAQEQKEQAERNLAYARKGNAILGSVFTGLDPTKSNYATVAELRNALTANLLKAARELDGSAIGDPLVVAEMQGKLGRSLLVLGEYEHAVTLLKKDRETVAARRGAGDLETLDCVHNLAVAYQFAGKVDLALPLFEEAYKQTAARLGADDPDTLASMGALASAYQLAGDRGRALPLFEKTLERRKARLGADDPHTLTSMTALASAYADAGKFNLALPLLKEAYERRKAKSGADDRDTLADMSNLASTYTKALRPDKAVALAEDGLARAKDTLGPDHPDTLSIANTLAQGYQALGRLDKALPLMTETLEKMRTKHGPDHPSTLILINNLAQIYSANGQFDKALSLLEEVLPRLKARYGPDHPTTLTGMHNLGTGYVKAGQPAKGVPLLEEALAKLQDTLGPDDPDTLQTMRILGRAYCDAGNGAKATATLKAFIAGSRKDSPKDSPKFAWLLAQVSLDLLTCGEFLTAEGMLRECLAVREKTEPDAWTTLNTMSLLGEALLGQKKYADAEPLLLKGYEGMKAREKTIPPEGRARILEALDRLVKLYTATNKPDEAKKWQAERAKYPPPAAPVPRPKS